MNISTQHKNNTGAKIILACSLLGFIIALIDYFRPYGPIAHTGGTELVVATSFVIALLAYTLFHFKHLDAKWERRSIYIVMLLILLGSIFAAFLLESVALTILFIVSLIAWFIQAATR